MFMRQRQKFNVRHNVTQKKYSVRVWTAKTKKKKFPRSPRCHVSITSPTMPMPVVSIPIADKSQMLVGVSGFLDQWKNGLCRDREETHTCKACWEGDT